MGIFKKKNGEATKFTKAFASKDGKQSVFSKVLNTALDVIEFIPVVGTAAKGVSVGVKAAGKVAVKTAIKTSAKIAAKEALKEGGKVALSLAQANAQGIRANDMLNKQTFGNVTKLGDADEQAQITKESSKMPLILAGLAAGVGLFWFLKKK
jgi:hypothetical protein